MKKPHTSHELPEHLKNLRAVIAWLLFLIFSAFAVVGLMISEDLVKETWYPITAIAIMTLFILNPLFWGIYGWARGRRRL